jgi:3-oxoadipate enol-lactonase
VPAGEYTTAQLGQDVVDLLDHLESERVHFCGLSMGGMVGQWLALHAPHRLLSLTLANTAARIGTAETWNARIQTVREQGMEAIVEPVLERWFTPAARINAALIEPVQAMLRATSPVGYVGCCAAIREMDLRVGIASIATPTLVIAGLSDLVTPLADAQFLANQIAGARLTELRAAHLSNVESADPFTEALLEFWGADPARAGDSAPQWPPR